MLTDRRMTDNVRWMPDHLPVRIVSYKVTQVILFLLSVYDPSLRS